MVTYAPCPNCRKQGRDNSGDNLAVYGPGDTYCFSCGYYEGTKDKKGGDMEWLTTGKVAAIPSRKLSEETVRKFNVQVFTNGLVFNYKNNKGELIAQHVRKNPKKYTWNINKSKGYGAKDLPLFGSHLWRPHPNLTLVITEGEIDAMSISQIQNHKWPVVSIPNGASCATDSIKTNLEYIMGFKDVVLCFDNDGPGQEAAQECSELFPPGRCRVAELPRKDANEMLLANEAGALMDAIRSAKERRPDGVVSIADVDVSAHEAVQDILDYPFPRLTNNLIGKRKGELWVLTAGSGTGKTTVEKEFIYHDVQQGLKVGVLNLEESCKETKMDLMGLYLNKPLRKSLALHHMNKTRAANNMDTIPTTIEPVTEEEFQKAKEWLDKQDIYLFDHFGSMDSEVLLNKIRYMIVGLGCDIIYLDHISIVISGQDTGNERLAIDNLMTNLRSIVEETNVHMCVISHLRKKNGTSHEEGGTISSDDLRGSGAIKQLSDGILGLERNQQAGGGGSRNVINIRVCKDRFAGSSGIVSTLIYETETGRLHEIETVDQEPIEEDESIEDNFN